MEPTLEKLADSIARWTGPAEQTETGIPGLSLFRRCEISLPANVICDPFICVVVQGRKQVALGEDIFISDAHQYLLSSVLLPTLCEIVEASEDKPCLGVMLKFDQRELTQLMVNNHLPVSPPQQTHRGMATGDITKPLLTAFQRLLDLLDEPQDIPILAPNYQREIFYRLLVGNQGIFLRQTASVGSKSNQIARAIEWLNVHFNQQMRVEDLAGQAQMSVSSFHHHFRVITAMSPLQFQKRLRLSEARRLMFSELIDAKTAALQVGYESASQFNREYSRLFGKPPLRDITILRQKGVPLDDTGSHCLCSR